jgi:hypothetical protein
MFNTRYKLASGFSDPESAIEPLNAAVKWMKNASGKISIPKSRIRLKAGRSKAKATFEVNITIEKNKEDYDVIADVSVPLFWNLSFYMAIISFSIIVMIASKEWMYLVLIVPLAISQIIFIRYAKNSIEDVFRKLSALYRNTQQVAAGNPPG